MKDLSALEERLRNLYRAREENKKLWRWYKIDGASRFYVDPEVFDEGRRIDRAIENCKININQAKQRLINERWRKHEAQE